MPFIIDGKSARQGFVPEPGAPARPRTTPLPRFEDGPSQHEFDLSVQLADALAQADKDGRPANAGSEVEQNLRAVAAHGRWWGR